MSLKSFINIFVSFLRSSLEFNYFLIFPFFSAEKLNHVT